MSVYQSLAPSLWDSPHSLAHKVGRVLQALAQVGDQIPEGVSLVSLFHSAAPPTVPISSYYCYIAIHAGLVEE